MHGLTAAAAAVVLLVAAAAAPVIAKVVISGDGRRLLFLSSSPLAPAVRRCLRRLLGGDRACPASPMLGLRGDPVAGGGDGGQDDDHDDDHDARVTDQDDLLLHASLDDVLLRRAPSRRSTRSRPPSRSGVAAPPSPNVFRSASPSVYRSTSRRSFLRKSTTYDSSAYSYAGGVSSSSSNNSSSSNISSSSNSGSYTGSVVDNLAMGVGGGCDFAQDPRPPPPRSRTQSWGSIAVDGASGGRIMVLEVRDGIVCQREVESAAVAGAGEGTGAEAGDVSDAADVGSAADLVQLAAEWAWARGVDTNVGLEDYEGRSVLGRAVRKLKAKSRRRKQERGRDHAVQEARGNWARRSLELGGGGGGEGESDVACADLWGCLASPRRSLSVADEGSTPPPVAFSAGLPDATDPTVLEALVEVPHLERTPRLGAPESDPSRGVVAVERAPSGGGGGRFKLSFRGLKRRSKSAPEARRRRADSRGSDMGIKRRQTLLSWGKAT